MRRKRQEGLGSYAKRSFNFICYTRLLQPFAVLHKSIVGIFGKVAGIMEPWDRLAWPKLWRRMEEEGTRYGCSISVILPLIRVFLAGNQSVAWSFSWDWPLADSACARKKEVPSAWFYRDARLLLALPRSSAARKHPLLAGSRYTPHSSILYTR